MKTLFIISFAFLVLGTACKKDDSEIISNDTPSDLTSGVWKISYYYDKDKDQTMEYGEFRFEFKNSGEININNNCCRFAGTWSTDKSDGISRIVLNTGTTYPLEKLNDEWKVIENMGNKLKLEEVEDNGGGIEYLNFIKL